MRGFCEYLGVPLETIIGVRDEGAHFLLVLFSSLTLARVLENDIEMLQTVGLGVCMENGRPLAQQVSVRSVHAKTSHIMKTGFQTSVPLHKQ